MGEETLIIASRSSQLARLQVEEARAALQTVLPDAVLESTFLGSPGDRDLDTPLSDVGVPDDFFTRDLDDALLEGRADATIHSAKDLPQTMPDGLVVAALLPAQDIRDALVYRRNGLPGEIPQVIGTSSPRREQFARALYPNAELKSLRGTIPERMEKLDRGDYDAIIVAACALKRLGLGERIGEYLAYDPTPQQGRLAIVTRADATVLRNACRAIDVRRTAGLVAIVGCPADASLISRRAELYLEHADVVLHDRLLPDAVLLRIRGQAIPAGKAGGDRSTRQSEIHRILLEQAEPGKLVVRLQGGDPGIFGHLAEELEFLDQWNIRTDIVPAPTVAQVAAAKAGAGLTHRGAGSGVTVMTARQAGGELPERFPGPETGNCAIYMTGGQFDAVSTRLMEAGWPSETPVVVGERIGYKDERFHHTSVAKMPALTPESPAVSLVGVQTFPSNNAMLFLGTEPGHFLKYGPLVHWPLIRLVPRPLEERAAHVRDLLDEVTGILLPGRFAVRVFIEALLVDGDTRALAGKKLLAVGPATAEELRRAGLRADLAADSLGGVRDLARLLTGDFAGRYLYPCSDAAPQKERSAFLAPHGVELVPCVFYANRAMPFKSLPKTPFARVMFTSTSTVRAYFDAYPEERRTKRTWVAVGPSTLTALKSLDLEAELLEGVAAPAPRS